MRTTVGWTLAALTGATTAWGVARRRRDPTPHRLRCIETQRLEPGCRVHLLCCEGHWVLIATTRERALVLARWHEERRVPKPFPKVVPRFQPRTPPAGDTQ